MGKRGFTLIELLVVIAIVAILAAILFPVFVTAKERGRQATCCSNLKQLSQAIFSYADDNDGRVPIAARRHFNKQLSQTDDIEWTGTQWYGDSESPKAIDVRKGSLWRNGYLRSINVFNCPTDSNIPSWWNGSKIPGKFGLSYSMNYQLADRGISSGSSLITTIKLSPAVAGRSSQVLFLIHETRGSATQSGINDGLFSWPGDTHDKIHNDGTICTYADGHVHWLSNDEMAKSQTYSSGHPSPWFRNSYYYYYMSACKTSNPYYSE